MNSGAETLSFPLGTCGFRIEDPEPIIVGRGDSLRRFQDMLQAGSILFISPIDGKYLSRTEAGEVCVDGQVVGVYSFMQPAPATGTCV